MTRAELLTKAAGKLTEQARDLKDAHSVQGDWFVNTPEDMRARVEHDELIELSAGLLAMANIQ
jgi:hypothetical protein